jgi:hypothetical protein
MAYDCRILEEVFNLHLRTTDFIYKFAVTLFCMAKRNGLLCLLTMRWGNCSVVTWPIIEKSRLIIFQIKRYANKTKLNMKYLTYWHGQYVRYKFTVGRIEEMMGDGRIGEMMGGRRICEMIIDRL